MKNISERTFGSRLRKAQDLATFIVNFNGYNPPRSQESVGEFNALITEIVASNATEITARQSYNTAVVNRYQAFRVGSSSITKMLTAIRNVVIAQYGKDSIEHRQTEFTIDKVRSGKLTKTTLTDGTTEAKVSHSERSYGSTTQHFSNLVSTLQTFAGYNPSKAELQLPQLQTFVANLTVLNDTVALNFQKIKDAKEKRRNFYNDLSDRATRIKAYIKGTYNPNSQEYIMVKDLVI